MDDRKIRELSSKYAPEELDCKKCLFSMRLAIGETRRFLDDHPKTKEKILKLLKKSEG